MTSNVIEVHGEVCFHMKKDKYLVNVLISVLKYCSKQDPESLTILFGGEREKKRKNKNIVAKKVYCLRFKKCFLFSQIYFMIFHIF